ncbi:MAG: hypothetical protein Q8O68_01165, partial [Candidatus Daviesbacteria bacterium]|nr:hypothetical protein [Candidatus Daviesbacteria bacterium]
SQLVNALQTYYVSNGAVYPPADNVWITALVNNGDIKNVPSVVTSSCTTNNQNGYCYKLSDDGTEAIVYTSLESSERPSGTNGTTPYFLWSSATGKSGIYYSITEDVTETSGFTFGPSSTLTQGLVGWWKMNGNADDSSGNGNNGTVIGATPTINKQGEANKAYSFNGSNNYISMGTSASLNMDTNDFTISAWAKALGGITGRGIINKGGWGSVGYFMSEAYSPANTYYFGIRDSAGYKPISFANEIWNWKHIVGIKNNKSFGGMG